MIFSLVSSVSYYFKSVDSVKGASVLVDCCAWKTTDLLDDAKVVTHLFYLSKLVMLYRQKVETQNHLLTRCHFTSFLWFKALTELGLVWVASRSIRDFFAADLGRDLGTNFLFW